MVLIDLDLFIQFGHETGWNPLIVDSNPYAREAFVDWLSQQ